jgi:Cu(I)/Ag(I) efflux system membrane fusion protein
MKKSVILFIAMLLMTATMVNAGTGQKTKTDAAISAATRADGKHATLKVEGLCEMCNARIEKAAKAVGGVSAASRNQKTKELHLHYNASKTNVEVVSKAIAKVGHDTADDKADDKIYAALPDCCKYRK